MEAIAAEAGITKPILYRHFGDREGLVQALADRFADELVARLAATLPTDKADQVNIRATVASAIDSYIAFIEADPALYRFLTHQTTAGGDIIMSVVDRVATLLASIIGEGLRLFGTDSGAAETWAYGVVGMVHLAGDRWVEHPTMPRVRLVDYLTSLLWVGMAGSVLSQVADPADQEALLKQLLKENT